MGLDMYALATHESTDQQVDFHPSEYITLHTWRKHPNLHGWMEQLYFEKGGNSDCFNCTTVALTADDLDRLETAIHMNALPNTSGFFFGKSNGAEIDDDLDFIRKARQAISEGSTVFYDSWW